MFHEVKVNTLEMNGNTVFRKETNYKKELNGNLDLRNSTELSNIKNRDQKRKKMEPQQSAGQYKIV